MANLQTTIEDYKREIVEQTTKNSRDISGEIALLEFLINPNILDSNERPLSREEQIQQITIKLAVINIVRIFIDDFSKSLGSKPNTQLGSLLEKVADILEAERSELGTTTEYTPTEITANEDFIPENPLDLERINTIDAPNIHFLEDETTAEERSMGFTPDSVYAEKNEPWAALPTNISPSWTYQHPQTFTRKATEAPSTLPPAQTNSQDMAPRLNSVSTPPKIHQSINPQTTTSYGIKDPVHHPRDYTAEASAPLHDIPEKSIVAEASAPPDDAPRESVVAEKASAEFIPQKETQPYCDLANNIPNIPIEEDPTPIVNNETQAHLDLANHTNKEEDPTPVVNDNGTDPHP